MQAKGNKRYSAGVLFINHTVSIIETRAPLARGRERGMGGEGGNAPARSWEYFLLLAFWALNDVKNKASEQDFSVD